MIIRIATRQSPLALWQANHVYDLLKGVDPTLKVVLVPVETGLDKDLSVPIGSVAGQGAFSKEVQLQVLAGKADIAVHSAKDLQTETPKGLSIGAFVKRGQVHDVLVGKKLKDLGIRAKVATGSARRKAQLVSLRPDLDILELRGNIDTRLAKLEQVDAIVMAACALTRLGRRPTVVDDLDPRVFVPQVGQGALAVEAKSDDLQILKLLGAIDHGRTRTAVEAERDFLVTLGANCDMPVGAFANVVDDELHMRGFMAGEKGKVARDSIRGPIAGKPGVELAEVLKQKLDQ